MKITKLAILMDKIHEIYYVLYNSYRLKIKKTGTKTPVFFTHISSIKCGLILRSWRPGILHWIQSWPDG